MLYKQRCSFGSDPAYQGGHPNISPAMVTGRQGLAAMLLNHLSFSSVALNEEAGFSLETQTSCVGSAQEVVKAPLRGWSRNIPPQRAGKRQTGLTWNGG